MSLRPGIGFSSLYEMASTMLFLDWDELEKDVPHQVTIAGKKWPLGRYLRQKLRLMIGKEVKVPDEILEELAEKMRPLREAARASEDNPSFRNQVIEAFAQECLNFEKRQHIFKKGETL